LSAGCAATSASKSRAPSGSRPAVASITRIACRSGSSARMRVTFSQVSKPCAGPIVISTLVRAARRMCAMCPASRKAFTGLTMPAACAPYSA
jgi:hypothetical protein